MATQRCPKCKSKRVRQGYRPTSTLRKFIFRYHLLCDDCNWEFIGFAIPGTVRKKTKRKKPNSNVEFENNPEVNENEADLISKMLLNGQEIKDFPESIEKERKLQKVISKQPDLFENEVENRVETKINFAEHPVKRQKFRKKVRVKFY